MVGHAALYVKIDEFRRETNEKHDLTAFKIQVMGEQIKSGAGLPCGTGTESGTKTGSLNNRHRKRGWPIG